MKILELFKRFDKEENSLCKPYFIAEAGVNHEGKMELAKRLIREAKEGGADAIKFQAYKCDTIACKHSPAYWDTKKESTKSQYELFKKYDKFWKKEFEELKKYCGREKIEFLCTPFDLESAKFLNDMVDVFKVSSSDITNRPFIEYICDFGKPIILSTGASYLHEIEEALSWIENYGNKTAILHCVLNYPTQDSNANLGMILDLKKRFPGKIIGYSDHTLPKDIKVLEVVTLLGARIIEKHFTFDKNLPGNDHYHSMDKEDLKLFRSNIDKLFTLLGSFNKSALPSERLARKNARRSLVAKKFVPKGKKIKYEDLTFKRPAEGISPKNIKEVEGSFAAMDIKKDTVVKWGMIRKS